MNSPIDIIICAHQRREMTFKTIKYLNSRTKYPHRIFVVDNHSTDGTKKMLKEMEGNEIFLYVRYSRNVGIHMAWNLGLSLVDSDYFVTMDNDIYVPEHDPCWLTQMVELMDKNKNYSAIALQPHVFLGAAALSDAKNGVYEVPMCGAVARIMRTDVVKKVGGWDRRYDANRNHEEKTICSRIQSIGGKVGYAEKLVAYHDFGDDNNWGYKEIHPHKHGHRVPGEEIWPMPEMLHNHDLDNKTWQKKV